MPPSKRIPKTLNRRLHDLEEHLFLLQQSLRGLRKGQSAYLKSLSTELRVLVCFSSNTEGLLWQLTEELNIQDEVFVHQPFKGVKKDHPLFSKNPLLFVPIVRAGMGDPRLPQVHLSLKEIIKNRMAVYIFGKSITHEQIIKAVSQQMGSAHEDKGVDPYIIELFDTIISNTHLASKILITDALLVLEIGIRVLDQAEKSLGFTRNYEIDFDPTNPGNWASPQISYGKEDFESFESPIANELTIFFLINHPQNGWEKDQNTYALEVIKKEPLTITPTKYSNGILEIKIEGLTSYPILIQHPIPETKNPGVAIAIVLKDNEIEAYYNGTMVEKVTF